jgi:hypothetical protein
LFVESSIRKVSAHTLLANSELSAGSNAVLGGAVDGFAAFALVLCLSFDLAMVTIDCGMLANKQQSRAESFSGALERAGGQANHSVAELRAV